MRFRLRTLLIVLALGPPLLAGCFGPIEAQPQAVQLPPALVGSWTTEDVEPALSLTFSANLDLQVRDEADQLIRTLAYRWRSDRLLELSNNDANYKLSGIIMIVERGRDDDHIALSLPRNDASDDQVLAATGPLFEHSRLILHRVQ